MPADVAAGHSINGINCRCNLKPVGTVEIGLETGGSGTVKLSLAVGIKGGSYLIATAVPVQ